MKTRIALVLLVLAASVLAGCASRIADTLVSHTPNKQEKKADLSEGHTSSANTLDGYKRDLALQISQMNASKVYSERPQALLRSVIVLRYVVDARGNLVRSEIMRSNRDRETEATALATLRNSSPFPKPAAHLLRRGQLELSETWLFNHDGRFQLRTVALPQMDQ